MPYSSLQITYRDAYVSGVLGRLRLDGIDQVSVPFEEHVVHTWQRGAPTPGTSVYIFINIVWVRVSSLDRPACRADDHFCCCRMLKDAEHSTIKREEAYQR